MIYGEQREITQAVSLLYLNVNVNGSKVSVIITFYLVSYLALNFFFGSICVWVSPKFRKAAEDGRHVRYHTAMFNLTPFRNGCQPAISRLRHDLDIWDSCIKLFYRLKHLYSICVVLLGPQWYE